MTTMMMTRRSLWTRLLALVLMIATVLSLALPAGAERTTTASWQLDKGDSNGMSCPRGTKSVTISNKEYGTGTYRDLFVRKSCYVRFTYKVTIFQNGKQYQTKTLTVGNSWTCKVDPNKSTSIFITCTKREFNTCAWFASDFRMSKFPWVRATVTSR